MTDRLSWVLTLSQAVTRILMKIKPVLSLLQRGRAGGGRNLLAKHEVVAVG